MVPRQTVNNGLPPLPPPREHIQPRKLEHMMSQFGSLIFKHFFLFALILSKLCSSPLTCLIFPHHMPCSRALFFSSHCYPFSFVLSPLYKQWGFYQLVTFFTCLLSEPTPFLGMCSFYSDTSESSALSPACVLISN